MIQSEEEERTRMLFSSLFSAVSLLTVFATETKLYNDKSLEMGSKKEGKSVIFLK